VASRRWTRAATSPTHRQHLATTLPLGQVDASQFDAVFYPGGHGPLWDLARDADSIALIETFDRANKPLGLVCHAPAALVAAKKADGSPLVAGRKVTGFSNSEEDAVGLSAVVPFLIEDAFTRLGGDYAKGPDWQSFVVTDGRLVTGQNPASSEAVAQALLAQLG
jgi:putative intracellular protease/amidase